MSKRHFEFKCPNCSASLSIDFIALELAPSYTSFCYYCFYPLKIYFLDNHVELRIEPRKKTAFLIHSSKPEERNLLKWFRALLNLYGVTTKVIEEDPRSVDWLQKSLDGINSTDFVLAFLTKRYRVKDESDNVKWKAPDKCYEEIAISFALRKDLYALVEKEVDPGNVLQTRAWCYEFEKSSSKEDGTPMEADREFFRALDDYVNP